MTDELSSTTPTLELDRLAQFVLEATLDDVPADVVAFVKDLTLKTVSGMLAGARFAPGPQMIELIRAKGLPAKAPVIGCDVRTAEWEAVFLSNFIAHATETEDDRLKHGVAWDIAVVPVVLALAGPYRLTGRQVLEATIMGLEVHCRTADANAEHLGLWCVPAAVGTAAAAARIKGLTHEQTMNAMGMALASAAVSEVNLGSDAHGFESAMQCLQAIAAVDAAQAGLTSNPRLRQFLERLVGPENVFPEVFLGGLWKSWSLMDINIKKYPACSSIHRPADALRELMSEDGFSGDDVVELVAEISPYDTFNDRPDPISVNDAKFSYQHCLGAVLVDGNIDFSNITAIDDPRYIEARHRVRLYVHADWSPLMHVSPNAVTVRLADGTERRRERQEFKGSRADPLTHEEFVDLFRVFTDAILTVEEVDACVGLLGRLETLDNLDALLSIVAPARNRQSATAAQR
jgi:2-methylcitrate dehydratase PrpD